MTTKTESRISRCLREVLAGLTVGACIGESIQLSEALIGLEYFLPQQVLGEIYPEWKHEGLDGIIPVIAFKAGEEEAQIFGLCILISDQSVTAIHIHLQLASASDEITWLKCRLGERGNDGMARLPYRCLETLAKRVHSLDGCPDSIDWTYNVTFGERRPVI